VNVVASPAAIGSVTPGPKHWLALADDCTVWATTLKGEPWMWLLPSLTSTV
jgi:hypothetical protein